MSAKEDEAGNVYESEEQNAAVIPATAGSMTLGELERFLALARSAGATDLTRVYLSCKRRQYMSDIEKVDFQKRENWPKEEWPIVIAEK